MKLKTRFFALIFTISIGLLLTYTLSQQCNARRLAMKEGALFTYTYMDSIGFVVSTKMKGVGKIIASDMKSQIILDDRSIVCIDVGSKQGVNKGDRFFIFRISDIRDQLSEDSPVKYKGFLVHILGVLEVMDAGMYRSSAQIIRSFEEVNAGNELLPYSPISEKITIKKASSPLEARIIGSREGLFTIGEYHIVYIDKGSDHGVQKGNLFTLYRFTIESEESKKRDDTCLIKVGQLLVLATQKATSTCLVTESIQALLVGERARAEM